jgi:prolyl oligopeptidase
MKKTSRAAAPFLHGVRKATCILGLVCTAVMTGASARAQEPIPVPATPKKPVVEEFHGLKIADDYRWLEDWNDPTVREWSDAQNRSARAYLNGLTVREPIRKWLREVSNKSSVTYFGVRPRGNVFFSMKFQPPKNQPYLVTLASLDDLSSERVILDPNQLNPKGTTAIDFYVPSLDGRFVAVSLSEGGSEEGTVHVYEVAAAKETGDLVLRVNGGTAGGSVAWLGDGSGFFYTRYPREGERPKEDLAFYQQVYFHKIGTPTSADTYAIGKAFPRIAEIQLQVSLDGQYVLAAVENGDGGEFAHYLQHLDSGRKDSWTQLTQFPDKVSLAVFGRDQALYLLSRKDSPRGKVLRVPLAKPALANAETVVPESDRAIEGLVPSITLLYVIDSDGGPSRIRVFDQKGQAKGEVPTLPTSAVYGAFSPKGDDLVFDNESYLAPGARYRYDAATGKLSRTAMVQTSPVDFSDVEAVREWAVSKDRTKIPISILRRKGAKLDGNSPALLTGYGGFGFSQRPFFDPNLRLWLDRGGVFAVANLRGGGEYGEEWHQAGNLTRKQNVFDDFAACANHLREAGYTKPEKLAILGGSNGGLLMGAALVQHPAMFHAVVSFVGIYDMLRNEAMTENAVFNITEFGTVNDPEQFKALYAYLPYHHVVDGTAYPAVLFLTGANDPRVNPANSRKMAARLQAATSSHAPVLLRTSAISGHGVDTGLDEQIEESADGWAFLFDQLGLQMPKPPEK